MQQFHEGVWAQLAHQIRRHVVVGARQAPFQGHQLPKHLFTVILGLPYLARLREDGLRLVDGLVTRGIAALHSKGIEVRFHGGTDLPPPGGDHIIHESPVIRPSHVCLDIARLCLHTHEACPEEELHIPQ